MRLLVLTWSLGSLLGGRVFAFGLDGGRVEDPGGGAVLAEVILEAFDGAIQLVGPDLEVDVHKICRRQRTSVSGWNVARQIKTCPGRLRLVIGLQV